MNVFISNGCPENLVSKNGASLMGFPDSGLPVHVVLFFMVLMTFPGKECWICAI